MARWTQYIGLSPEGQEFVKDAKIVATYVGTTGIADEPVYFNIYSVYYGDEYTHYEQSFIEVQQTEIWSSGPMIFTCLVQSNDVKNVLCEWTEEEMSERYI